MYPLPIPHSFILLMATKSEQCFFKFPEGSLLNYWESCDSSRLWSGLSRTPEFKFSILSCSSRSLTQLKDSSHVNWIDFLQLVAHLRCFEVLLCLNRSWDLFLKLMSHSQYLHLTTPVVAFSAHVRINHQFGNLTLFQNIEQRREGGREEQRHIELGQEFGDLKDKCKPILKNIIFLQSYCTVRSRNP